MKAFKEATDEMNAESALRSAINRRIESRFEMPRRIEGRSIVDDQEGQDLALEAEPDADRMLTIVWKGILDDIEDELFESEVDISNDSGSEVVRLEESCGLSLQAFNR